VEATWKGGSTWYHGRIAKVHSDGTYDIDYDDGTKDTRIKEKAVREVPSTVTPVKSDAPTSGSGPKFKVGDKIEGKWKNLAWYPGRIAQAHSDGVYDIDYDDGFKETRIAADLVRVIAGPSLPTPAPAPVSPSGSVSALFKVGDRIQG
jgi:hypothetical protein